MRIYVKTNPEFESPYYKLVHLCRTKSESKSNQILNYLFDDESPVGGGGGGTPT